ncbi:hypothetical protein [Maridesulfovibrio hydrothermalis]|uniref:Uncharacterized protein n=1 Tax=Maridesulfovibrio hydrothermalis AM13 = DSM 14728 TaxID=1121451 RepID=L0RAZ8_9BACT|nr:hypothetical protein [Maridesulfovibrio hydrothermalis]CCO23938.1 conserved protein of unknown function [Maridesulfovibrio hydrothermalis AM13 = DSM 14728]
MEISFRNESVNSHLRNENTTRPQSAPAVNRETKLDTISGNIRSGRKSAETDPEKLLEQTMEASPHENAINEAHDFDMARVMALLSDPLLKEDI